MLSLAYYANNYASIIDTGLMGSHHKTHAYTKRKGTEYKKQQRDQLISNEWQRGAINNP